MRTIKEVLDSWPESRTKTYKQRALEIEYEAHLQTGEVIDEELFEVEDKSYDIKYVRCKETGRVHQLIKVDGDIQEVSLAY